MNALPGTLPVPIDAAHTATVALDLVQDGEDLGFIGMNGREQGFGDGRQRLAQVGARMHQRLLDGFDRGGIQIAGQCDTADLGTDATSDRVDVQRQGGRLNS